MLEMKLFRSEFLNLQKETTDEKLILFKRDIIIIQDSIIYQYYNNR
jgi:hypothetical protein